MAYGDKGFAFQWDEIGSQGARAGVEATYTIVSVERRESASENRPNIMALGLLAMVEGKKEGWDECEDGKMRCFNRAVT